MQRAITKKILLILMLIVLAFSFFGCASVRANIISNEDGTIDELVTISLDKEAILNAGEDLEQVKNYVYSLAYSKANDKCNDLTIKINKHLFFGVDAETAKILNSYKGGMEVVESKWENNTITIGVRFASNDVYKYHYGITENNKPVYYKEENFLYTKMYFYSSTLYTRDFSLYTEIKNEISRDYPELVNVGEVELLYTYITESRREHSDADYVTNNKGKYYHTWVIDEEKIAEPIMIYYNVANSGNWIIVCIFISLLTCVVMLVVGLILKQINKKKKKPPIV